MFNTTQLCIVSFNVFKVRYYLNVRVVVIFQYGHCLSTARPYDNMHQYVSLSIFLSVTTADSISYEMR